jgi:hypothetical protein
MAGINNRKHQRLKHSATIRVCSGSDITNTFDMRDFSESGMFLLCDDTQFLHLEDEVTVQTMELEDAPILKASVVRIEENIGFAVTFL